MLADKTLLATTDHDLARAECDANGNWSVDFLLEDKPVTCIAGVPHPAQTRE